MIKIKLPSSSSLSNEDWLEQMELSLYHIKKAYEKFTRDIEEEKKGDVSIRFSYPEMEKNKTFEELLEKEEIHYDDTQEVEIIIDY